MNIKKLSENEYFMAAVKGETVERYVDMGDSGYEAWVCCDGVHLIAAIFGGDVLRIKKEPTVQFCFMRNNKFSCYHTRVIAIYYAGNRKVIKMVEELN